MQTSVIMLFEVISIEYNHSERTVLMPFREASNQTLMNDDS